MSDGLGLSGPHQATGAWAWDLHLRGHTTRLVDPDGLGLVGHLLGLLRLLSRLREEPPRVSLSAQAHELGISTRPGRGGLVEARLRDPGQGPRAQTYTGESVDLFSALGIASLRRARSRSPAERVGEALRRLSAQRDDALPLDEPLTSRLVVEGGALYGELVLHGHRVEVACEAPMATLAETALLHQWLLASAGCAMEASQATEAVADWAERADIEVRWSQDGGVHRCALPQHPAAIGLGDTALDALFNAAASWALHHSPWSSSTSTSTPPSKMLS